MDRIITMSQKKLNHSHVLERLINDNTFSNAQAAKAMGLSERHVIRLKGEYKKNGIDALIHKNIGRAPAHAISEEMRQRIIEIKKLTEFKNVNFAHFQEILGRKRFDIKISYSSLYSIMISAGFKSPKTRRPSKKHRRRKRKAREGIMLQIDASPFCWLNNDITYSLHGAIDDATGKIAALYICKNECMHGYFEVMRQVISENGIPVSLYSDRHTIFVSPKDGKLTIEDELKGVMLKDTQFGRAMKQLGITIIKAKSAPAKGRIERLWETLQSRLPVEFALENIDTVDKANVFLKEYLHVFNKEFAVIAEDREISYRELSPAVNLENILCVMEERTFDKGGIFSFHNHTYQILFDKNSNVIPHKGKAKVLVSPVFGIRASFAGIVYETQYCLKPKKAKTISAKPAKQKTKYIPDDSHYYKYGHELIKKVSFEDSDYAILKMLERIFLWKTPK
jgi:transposase